MGSCGYPRRDGGDGGGEGWGKDGGGMGVMGRRGVF